LNHDTEDGDTEGGDDFGGWASGLAGGACAGVASWASEDCLSCWMASRSNSGSIRVFALDTSCSVREYTILSAARQMPAQSQNTTGSSASLVTVSQNTVPI